MFPLTRPVRQGVATAALFLLTVVPTALVGVHAWRINRPGHIRDVEIELGRQLGIQVTLEGVRYPRPGEIVYRGLVLRHEEPRGKGLTEIARADVVRAIRGAHDLTLHAENLRLRGDSPKQTLEHLGSLIQRSSALPFERLNLAATRCQLDLGSENLTFSVQGVAGEFVANSASPTLRVAYRLAEPGVGTQCELMLSRNRLADPVRTTMELKTLEGAPLPGRVLDVFFDTARWLGPRARVEGTLMLDQTGTKDWEGQFRGNLLDVDLATLVGEKFPRHRLAGLARVALQTARWGNRSGHGPGWIEARGALIASQGIIGVDLVNALAREMRFRLSPRMARLDSRRTELDFQSLGVAFDMRADGEIHLAGALGREFTPETVLVSASVPLVYAPSGAASVHGLIKTLFPVADVSPGVLVPLTPQSRVLLCLPVAPEPASKAGRTLGAN
jgi:hypothetical protein